MTNPSITQQNKYYPEGFPADYYKIVDEEGELVMYQQIIDGRPVRNVSIEEFKLIFNGAYE